MSAAVLASYVSLLVFGTLRYFRALERMLNPSTGLLHIVSGASSSDAKIPYFPEHDEDELRVDLQTAPWLQLVPSYPRQCVYDFRTEAALLKAAHLTTAQAKLVQREGGTAGWSSLLRPLQLSDGAEGHVASVDRELSVDQELTTDGPPTVNKEL